ncbi:PhnD/SsuA/transferrin family substrate-binding protein [Xanthobacter sp. KR7-225]|uniref:ABC transporter substrate-binding protein n=1 Tax=Xanthobacter sp. KR7-225 TaxID=3156613 RepID=UPI0032B5A703
MSAPAPREIVGSWTRHAWEGNVVDHLTRRTFLGASFGASLAGGAIGVAGRAAPAFAQAAAPVRWASLAPGFTILVVQYILAQKLAEKHGVPLAAPTQYTAVSTYYNDFAAGNYDVCIGSWDTFAARQQAGVPIEMLCSITTADMIYIVTGDPAVTDVASLKGKTLAAAQSTGTFRMVAALIKELNGIELGKDVTIQGVDNPAAAMTLVMANRAEAGLSWEPNVTAALMRDAKLRPLFNAGESYRKATGLELPYFGVAVRRELAEKNPDLARRVRAMFEDCLARINADPKQAVAVAGQNSGFPQEVLAEAITSRRLRFQFGSMASAEGRATVTKASAFLARNGLLQKPVDDGFFFKG